MQRHLTLGLLLTFLPYFAFAQSSLRAGKDYAHFFYVTDFEPGWEALPETAGEVAAIAQELDANYGFTVRTYPNYTKQEILDEITRINNMSYGENDQILFFFSMHGQYSGASDEGFLIPHDGLLRDDYGDTWISYAELGRRIALNPAKHVLLALDACYSGAFGDRYRGRPEADPWDRELNCQEKVEQGFQYTSRLYFTAGGRRQRTPARSLFASRWLTFLREEASKKVLTKNELRYHLSSVDSPRPEGGTFTSRHEPGGDFIFVHRKNCTAGGEQSESADAKDWLTVGANRERAVEHLRQYPYCPHYQQALNIVAGVAARDLRNPGAPYTLNELPYMVPISGGTFQMGSKDGQDDEKPVHAVTLSDFRLGRYEVTVGEYLAFAEATGGNYPDWLEKGNQYHIETGSNDLYKKMGYSRISTSLPMVGVSWYDAVAYCNWLSEQHGYRSVYRISGETVTADWTANGYRLPTEAEWEYASRAWGGDQTWAGTSAESGLRSYANYKGTADGYEYTAPVGKLRPNGLGLHDMSGNVWEWCWDWYGDYSSGASRDPKGAATGSGRVCRGGSWDFSAAGCRSAYRDDWDPGSRGNFVGFRLARSE